LNTGLDIRLNRDALPEERVAYRTWSGRRLRPVVALLGLILISIVTLFGIASSAQLEQPGASMLFSCGPCHD
jgi:hypothetical protein